MQFHALMGGTAHAAAVRNGAGPGKSVPAVLVDAGGRDLTCLISVSVAAALRYLTSRASIVPHEVGGPPSTRTPRSPDCKFGFPQRICNGHKFFWSL